MFADMNKLSFKSHRIISGFVLLMFLFCVANYFLDFRFFGGFNREPMIASIILMAVYLRYFSPTLNEIKDYRDAKRKQTSSLTQGAEKTRENS